LHAIEAELEMKKLSEYYLRWGNKMEFEFKIGDKVEKFSGYKMRSGIVVAVFDTLVENVRVEYNVLLMLQVHCIFNNEKQLTSVVLHVTNPFQNWKKSCGLRD
jgi:hypothetical protein